MTLPFDLLKHRDGEDIDRDPGATQARRDQLKARKIPQDLSDLSLSAPAYQPDKGLLIAINAALAVGAPLLLTGEPGTGKTQVGHYLGCYFGVEVLVHNVRSDSSYRDLLYHFDTVRYFHAAHDLNRGGGALDPKDFREKGVLWRAFEGDEPVVVLIDEIDKAPRDLPNDLLNVILQREFKVPETQEEICFPPQKAPPILVLTSNSERRLPEAFLRRCIFYHLRLTEEGVERAIKARRKGDFPELSEEIISTAQRRFWDLRELELRKPPSTAELLIWLVLLSARGVKVEALRQAWREVPLLGALIKDRDDLEFLFG